MLVRLVRLALLGSGALSAAAACATVSGLDGLNEVDGTGDASTDQSAPSSNDGGSGGADGGSSSGTDAGTTKGDADKPKDAGKDTGPTAPVPNIACGVGKCSDAGQLCCYNRIAPKTSACEEIVASATCTPAMGKDPLYCDDKADCPVQKPFCCFDTKGTASCDTEANCAANSGRFLCTTLADCPDASVNCSAGLGVFNLVVCK